jgi:predicted protein tyrosine phosphatase
MITFSEDIRNYRGGVFNNPYQGKDKKVVFVCSMGILRSATAARIYAHKYNTRSAGTWEDALVPLSDALMIWADELVFVNKHNYEQVVHYLETEDEPMLDVVKRKSKVLDIPDSYEHMHPALIKAFEEQYERIND